MDKVTRLLLLNQYRLLKGSGEIPLADADRAITALSHGYPVDIENLVDREVLDETPREVCEEVRNILQLYRHIVASINKLPADAQQTVRAEDWAAFKGFDGNEETEHYAYVQYLLEECGLWKESYEQDMSLNTHAPALPKYRAMLKVHGGRPISHPMSEKDVLAVIAAEQ